MDVKEAAVKLTEAINIIMNPLSSSEDRAQANRFCEEFKVNSSLSVPCGLLLCTPENSDLARHYGLQLVEHNIKFRWNSFKPEEKLTLKTNVLQVLSSHTKHILVEQAHIKDVLSRIVVEMIKREWPQQWPNMMQELHDICTKGETQVELVLLIFLRLAEDVALFQTVPTRRRKDIYQALTMNLKDLFGFFLKTLNDNYELYSQKDHLTDEEERQKALVHCHLSGAVLKTFCGFLEWIPWSHITAENNLLLRVLCMLLKDPTLRLYAAECLVLIVSRKGKLEDRLPLLVLFSEDAMSVICSAASSSNSISKNEEDYIFLKKLCELLVNLGTQLAALWTADNDVKEPATFRTYLNAVLMFTDHPSVVLSELTVNLWLCFFSHPVISSNKNTICIVLDIVRSLTKKLVKAGFPSSGDSPTCEFSHMDFDSDEEFYSFYLKYRSEAVPLLKSAAKLLPEQVFSFGADSLLKLLEGYAGNWQEHNPAFPEQLDALATYLDSVCGCLYFDDKLKLCNGGTELLKYVVQFEVKDPAILSPLLSCMSAMFVFLTLAPELTPLLLNRLFHAAMLPLPRESSAAEIKSVRVVRKHASACIVKISKDHPKLLLPAFEEMYALAKALDKNPENHFVMEKCYILEALILISNEFCDFERQSSFLGEILAPVHELWKEFMQPMSTTETFIDFVGLRDSSEPNHVTELKSQNRSQITHCLNLIAGVVRRSKWPSDSQVAEKANFLVKSASGKPYFCNPAFCNVLPFFEGIFSFIRCINSLYNPSVQAAFHADYSSVLEITESEKRSVLGSYGENPSASHSADEPTDSLFTVSVPVKMQSFLFYQYEACLQLLGNTAQFCSVEFYALPELAKSIKSCVFAHMDQLPDFRIKSILHYFLHSLFRYCPPDFHHVVISVLQAFAPFMHQRISAQWQKLKALRLEGVDYEDRLEETKEILADRLCRQLSREYIDLLFGAMQSSNRWVDPTENSMEEGEQRPAVASSEKLSSLGTKILDTEDLRPVVVCTLFEALHWPDTVVSNKSSLICPSVFKQLKEDHRIAEEEAVFLMRNVLSGLSELGEHELNQSSLLSLGVTVYENMRPSCENLSSAITNFCGCSFSQIQKFDSMLLEEKPVSDKKKKDAFRSLVAEVIGKNVGQLFKNKIKIQNLPPLFKLMKPKLPLDETENDLGLCSLFSKDGKVQ